MPPEGWVDLSNDLKSFSLDQNLQLEGATKYNGFVAGARDITISLTVNMSKFNEQIKGLTRQFTRLGWAFAFVEFHRIGLTRPDGRPRRTGHRHRGTVGWKRRYRTK